MRKVVNCRLPEQVRNKLKENFRLVMGSLSELRRKLPLREKLAYALQLSHNMHPGETAGIATLQVLRGMETFKGLLQYVLSEPALQSVFLQSSQSDFSGRDLQDTVFRNALELTLLRAVAGCESKASSYIHDTDQLHDAEDVIEGFLIFLDLDCIERRVVVPLQNLELPFDRLAIAGFGQIQGSVRRAKRRVPDPDEVNLPTRAAQLTFTIETDHFLAALLFPISDEIRKRVTALRLASHPLTAYNHFRVEHFEPWEFPLHDSDFWARFWAYQGEKIKIPSSKFEQEQIEELELMFGNVSKLQWNKITPWRLAADRLDDAVFKLECHSPDAILDLVIGLESIYTESGIDKRALIKWPSGPRAILNRPKTVAAVCFA